jgi:hypothetical protein
MSLFAKLVILILLAEFSQNVDAYMRGAPPEACAVMEPQVNNQAAKTYLNVSALINVTFCKF